MMIIFYITKIFEKKLIYIIKKNTNMKRIKTFEDMWQPNVDNTKFPPPGVDDDENDDKQDKLMNAIEELSDALTPEAINSLTEEDLLSIKSEIELIYSFLKRAEENHNK